MPYQGVLPPIVVLPIAILAVLVITAHLAALHADHTIALSRKRIRTANGVVMLITSMVLAYAFAYTSTHNPAQFTIAWGAAIMLLTLVLALSTIDVLNNLRLSRLQRRRVKKAANNLHTELARLLREGQPSSPRLVRSPPDDQSPRDNRIDYTDEQASRKDGDADHDQR